MYAAALVIACSGTSSFSLHYMEVTMYAVASVFPCSCVDALSTSFLM